MKIKIETPKKEVIFFIRRRRLAVRIETKGNQKKVNFFDFKIITISLIYW